MNSKCRSIPLAALLATTAVLGSFFAGANPARAAQYVITEIEPLEGDDGSTAYDINNYGQVVGLSSMANSCPCLGFLWTPTTPNGTAGSPIDLGPSSTSLQTINDYGQVQANHHSVWTPTTPNGTTGSAVDVTTLLGVNAQDYFVYPFGLNNHGQIAGSEYEKISGKNRAFLWTPTTSNGGSGSHVYLEPPEGINDSYADAINNYGQVIGSTTGGYFLWTPAMPNGDSGIMVDLGEMFAPLAINDRGQLVGGFFLNEDGGAFLWTPDTPNGPTGTMLDLGSLAGPGFQSLAFDINAHGHVVGWSGPSAFLYTPETGMVDLNTLIDPLSGWHLGGAYGINDFGQIVGSGVRNGVGRAFLLTPTSLIDLPGDFNQDGAVNAADYVVWRNGLGTSFTQAHYDVWRANFGRALAAASSAPGSAEGFSPVPEPATAALLLVGFTMFAAIVRRRPLTRNSP